MKDEASAQKDQSSGSGRMSPVAQKDQSSGSGRMGLVAHEGCVSGWFFVVGISALSSLECFGGSQEGCLSCKNGSSCPQSALLGHSARPG